MSTEDHGAERSKSEIEFLGIRVRYVFDASLYRRSCKIDNDDSS